MRKGGQDRARENRGLCQHFLEILPGEAPGAQKEKRGQAEDSSRQS